MRDEPREILTLILIGTPHMLTPPLPDRPNCKATMGHKCMRPETSTYVCILDYTSPSAKPMRGDVGGRDGDVCDILSLSDGCFSRKRLKCSSMAAEVASASIRALSDASLISISEISWPPLSLNLLADTGTQSYQRQQAPQAMDD